MFAWGDAVSHPSSLGLRSTLGQESPLAVRLRRQRSPRLPDADEQSEEHNGDYESQALRDGFRMLRGEEDA